MPLTLSKVLQESRMRLAAERKHEIGHKIDVKKLNVQYQVFCSLAKDPSFHSHVFRNWGRPAKWINF